MSQAVPTHAVEVRSIDDHGRSHLGALSSHLVQPTGMTPVQLECVINRLRYVVTEPGLTPLKLHQLLFEEEYLDAQDRFGEQAFCAQTGDEAMAQLLPSANMEPERANLRSASRESGCAATRGQLAERPAVSDSRPADGAETEGMFRKLASVPLEPRSTESFGDGRSANASLDDRYRRVISRNDRLKRLVALRAPGIVLRNEIRMLRDAVSALFGDGEIAMTIAHLGGSIFADYLGYITGIGIDLPAAGDAARAA